MAEALVKELERRGHEPVLHGALEAGRARGLGLGERSRRARRGRGRSRPGSGLLLDGHGRVDRGEQGARGARGAVRRRRDRARRKALERRQRAGALAARHERGAAQRDPRRLVRGRRRATSTTTWPTSATWMRSPLQTPEAAPPAALARFLDSHGLAPGEVEFERIGEGHSNLTYLVRRGDDTSWSCAARLRRRSRPRPTTSFARRACSRRSRARPRVRRACSPRARTSPCSVRPST